MIPLIKLHNGDKYELVITDVTQDSDEYIPESVTSVEQYYKECRFKYSETNTVNIIELQKETSSEVSDPIITDHESYLDEAHYILPKDGYYVIHHMIIPTIEWYETEKKKQEKGWESIFDTDLKIYVSDCENIYFYDTSKKELINKTKEEIIQVNPEGTTISKIIIERFYIQYLYDCFIALCKRIFNRVNLRCIDKSNLGDLRFKRDFIWMSLNVIKYNVELGQFLEAERILEELNYCGGICNEAQLETTSDCGCHK